MGQPDELAVRAADGDLVAFRTLVDCLTPRLYALARNLLSDATEAEDATQEAWLRAYAALPRFAPAGEGACLAWLRCIVVNVCRDWLRRPQRRAVIFDGGAAAERATTATVGEGARMSVVGDRELVRVAVARLPIAYREVVALRYGQDLSYAEIARAVGANERTVATRLRRALDRLRRELEAEGLRDETITRLASE